MRFYKVFVPFGSLVFRVLSSAKMSPKKRKVEVDKRRKLDFFFSSSSVSGKIMFNGINNRLGFSISLLNRPVRSGLNALLNEFAEDASGLVVVTHGLAVVAL